MLEREFEVFLYADPQIKSDKAVTSRMARARKAERILNSSLDTVAASDDLTYDSLITLKQHENPRNAPLSNALRKYYIFRNGKEFPKLRFYRR